MMRAIAFAALLCGGVLSNHAGAKETVDCEARLESASAVTVVVDALTERENPKHFQDIFGVPVKWVKGPPPATPERIPGMVLHIGLGRQLAQHVIGDFNPMLINENLRVEDNKWNEYLMIHSVDPTAIPLSINAIDLIGPNRAPAQAFPTQAQISAMVARFFEVVRQKFPEGAFIKHSAEAGTADKGKMIMTFKTKPDDVAAQFFKEIHNLPARELKQALASQAFSKDRLDDFSAYSRLVVGLLFDPVQIFAQRKIEIMRTSDNANKEIRVDFVAGRAINAHNRWSLEYSPADLRRAKEFVDRFFAKAPLPIRRLTGGADVIYLTDGSLMFMELNVGSQSAYMDARDLMISANLLVSKLKGSPTALIERLETAYHGGFSAKQDLLNQFTARNMDGQYSQSLKDLPFAEVLTYFRNRAMDDLPMPAGIEARRRVMDEITALAVSQSRRIRNSEVRTELKDFLSATRASLEL